VCIDVYAASEEGLGLAYLDPLPSITGGAVFLYPSLDEAALPQVLLVPPSHQHHHVSVIGNAIPIYVKIRIQILLFVLHVSAHNLIMAAWRDYCFSKHFPRHVLCLPM